MAITLQSSRKSATVSKGEATMTAKKETQESILALASLHFSVFLWGFTAILGKLISYGAISLVWHRSVVTLIAFLCVPGTIQGIKNMSWTWFGRYFGIGVLVCIHWCCFYGSIKVGDSAR